MTAEGGTDADVFEAFLEHVLLPTLKPGDIVIVDNVGAHRPELMRKLIAQAGASMIVLPAYSRDMNPIELCWSKLKAALKDFGARTVDDLHQATRRAMDLMCADDAAGWFKHCGYGAPGK
jgi:transposase